MARPPLLRVAEGPIFTDMPAMTEHVPPRQDRGIAGRAGKEKAVGFSGRYFPVWRGLVIQGGSRYRRGADRTLPRLCRQDAPPASGPA